jgi:glycosyltransferase involved in cell wall biosynthesis
MHTSIGHSDAIQPGAAGYREVGHSAEQIKVLHVAETMKGGVGTILRALLEHQIGALGKDSVAAVVPDAHVGELDGISGNLVRFHRAGRDFRSLTSLCSALRRGLAAHQPDIVHLHSSFAGALGRVLILAARELRTSPKVVYTPHAFPFVMQCGPLKKRLFGFVEARLARLTDAIICVSDFEREAAVSAGIRVDRLHRIYNGVPLPRSSAKPRAERGAGPLKLLFVGRFDRQKGLDVLLDAMAKLPPDQFKLTVVGAAVNDAIGQPQLSNVDYQGWVRHDQLGSYYADADVLVMPSRWEGFALVPLEALSYGVPVVATRCCSMPEVIEHGKTGLLFDVDDSCDLASLLSETPRQQWLEMGSVGKQRVEAHFTGAKMQAVTLELYQTILAQSRRETGSYALRRSP